jgi:hypothetical protein
VARHRRKDRKKAQPEPADIQRMRLSLLFLHVVHLVKEVWNDVFNG